MKTYYFNLTLLACLIMLFIFNKRNNISFLTPNMLCCNKFENVIIYQGPGIEYPQARVILKKHYPLFILQKKNNWIKVIDYQGKEGWIQKHNLSDGKYGIITKELLFKQEQIQLMKHSRVKIINIMKNHCIIEVNQKKFRIKKQDIWTGN